MIIILLGVFHHAEPAGEQSVMQLSPQIPQTGNERITDPNANYYEIPWWEKEIKALTIDIAASIRFFQQECTDEEIWWLGEIAEDLAEKTQSRELLQSMRSRAELVHDKQKRKEALKDIDDAFDFITD